MIYTNLKTIQDNIITLNRPYWRMFQRDDKNMIADTSDRENITAKSSSEYLEKVLTELEGSGYVILKHYAQPLTKGGNNTGSLTYYVRIGSENDQSKEIAGNGNYNLISGYHSQILDLNMKLLHQQNEAAVKDLRREFEDKNKVGAVDPILKEVLGLAKLALFQGKNNSVVKEPTNNNTDHNKPINGIDDKKEFIDLVTRWHKLDNNYLDALKAIVYFAEKDPENYKMQVNFLITQYKST